MFWHFSAPFWFVVLFFRRQGCPWTWYIAKMIRMNFWFSCLCLLSGEITGMHYHDAVLGIKPRILVHKRQALYWLNYIPGFYSDLYFFFSFFFFWERVSFCSPGWTYYINQIVLEPTDTPASATLVFVPKTCATMWANFDFFKLDHKDLGDGLAVKRALVALAKDLGSVPRICIAPVPGKPKLSSDLYRHQAEAREAHTYMQAKHSYI